MGRFAPHPLAPLTVIEFSLAASHIRTFHPAGTSLFFRSIYLHEPPKAELTAFLAAEHAGELTESIACPARLVNVEYDLISGGAHTYMAAVVDLGKREVVKTVTEKPPSEPYFTPSEFALFHDACVKSPLFKDAMSEFTMPKGFDVVIDPWPYGPAHDTDKRRYMQGLVFAHNKCKNNPDSNHYAYPIPIIPVMDWATKEIVRIDRLATGGTGDPLEPAPRAAEPRKLFERSLSAEYVPEMQDGLYRTDLKPLNIVQPEGASFTVQEDNLVEWQKWRFRLSFTPREGAVLHDICYDGRPVLYRLSYSELTVPYADPRPPFHRKQAFDLGDGGVGRAANNLRLGCDCVGAIHYISSLQAASDGTPTPANSVVCLHEQDNGILWKHTNYRTNRAVVTRLRELVVQFIATLANYEYILAFKLDVAGNITVETRATGIVSVVAIDEGKTSEYGNVVAPGVMAQNHQHIFAVRIDPAIDSYDEGDNSIVIEETLPRPMDPATNPFGNLYGVERSVVEKARWMDADPMRNRVVRIENRHKKNEMSGKNVGYKLVPSAAQLLLADEESMVAKRAPYAKHHLWVTGYRDGELWAAGEFTNQSTQETGGVAEMVKRGDWFADDVEGVDVKAVDDVEGRGAQGKKSSPVLWSVFGFTHNPRVEDWPVMPVEIHQLHLKPADFFTANPALDVPGRLNESSVLVPCCGDDDDDDDIYSDSIDIPSHHPPSTAKTPNSPKQAPQSRASVGLWRTGSGFIWAKKKQNPSVQANPASHVQGSGPDIDAAAVGAGTNGSTAAGSSKRSMAGMVSGFVGRIRRSATQQ